LLGLVPLLTQGHLVYEELSTGHSLAEVAVPICIGFGVPFLIVLHMLDRLTTRAVIEVTRDSLAITLVSTLFGTRIVTWARKTIHEVKLNPNNGKLLVRATGREMAECHLVPDRELGQKIADIVREAVFLGTFDYGGVAGRSTRPRSGTAPLLICVLLMAIGGLILIFVPSTGTAGLGIMCLACLLAMITAGITMGTQKKDFFT
jgi:hypothetical protein